MKDGRRTLAAGGVLRELNTIEGRAAYLSLQQGTSGAGGPGGKGPGGGGKDGTDRGGDGRGSGAAWARIRRARQDRWRIIFNTVSDGADYRDKLRALGAILVVAEYQRDAAGRVLRDRTGRALLQYRLVIRDVRSGARPQAEDVRRLRGIFWIDDKPESVASLARALGIAPPPPLFAAFFPEKVEQELRRLEKAKYAGPEADIRRTFFHVDLTRDGGYRLTCDRVLLKTE